MREGWKIWRCPECRLLSEDGGIQPHRPFCSLNGVGGVQLEPVRVVSERHVQEAEDRLDEARRFLNGELATRTQERDEAEAKLAKVMEWATKDMPEHLAKLWREAAEHEFGRMHMNTQSKNWS